MRLRAFLKELRPLKDSETVLFIHYRQTEIGELNPLLKDRMGANDEARSTGTHETTIVSSSCRSLSSGEESDLHAHRLIESLRLLEPLPREDLRWSQHSYLIAGLHQRRSREERCDCLPGSNIPLKHSLHWFCTSQIPINLFEDPSLGRRQVKRKQVGNATTKFFSTLLESCCTSLPSEVQPTTKECNLEDKEVLPQESLVGSMTPFAEGRKIIDPLGEVDHLKSLSPRWKLEFLSKTAWNAIGNSVSEFIEGRPQHLPHCSLTRALRHRIHGHDDTVMESLPSARVSYFNFGMAHPKRR
jgi:hypothetical protein